MRTFLGLLAASLVLLHGLACAADERANHQPVRAVGDQRLEVQTRAGSGAFVFFASRPLADGAVQPDVDRVVLVVHGVQRNAGGYFAYAQAAAGAAPEAAAHTLLVAPQFLAERDVAAQELAAQTLDRKSVA